MASITLKNLSKSWGSFVAVDDLNLEVFDREFLVLLGPSGCGKTTTMRMIAGLEQETSGEVFIGTTKVNQLEPKDRDVAMVFQSYGLYPNMNVYENIRFPLKIRKIDPKTHPTRVNRAAEMVELTEFLHRKPSELSGGQKQRVALARAIVREPNVFLMDEPLSNLDAKLRVSTRAQIKHLHHEMQVTTIYVTHDQIEAMTLADRVVVLNKGVVQQIGTPSQIYDTPQNLFVAGFIGNPAMNLISGRIINNQFNAENISISGFKTNDGAITLGFRAEDATIQTKETQSETNNQISAPIYTLELLGDSTMVSFQIADSLISVKAPKDYSAKIGDLVNIQIPIRACHLFNTENGKRIKETR
ncbi:MAG: ABC transporter ATP-binding protein [Alphaproteobacteria bacterium]